MLFLFLQTLAWMTLVFFVGAALGCLARRTLGMRAADTEMVPAGAALAPRAAAAVARTPVVEAASAPRPVMPAAPATVPAASRAAGSPPYAYPVTTVGIPRDNPAPVQPQIQRIDLTPAAAAGPTPATVTIRQAATAAVAPAAVSGYPITTVGIPPGYTPSAPAGTPAVLVSPDAPAAPAGDAGRFDRALGGQPAAPSQPRPEPLRRELARPPTAVAAEPAKSGMPVEQPFTPVAASPAALSALAARAAAQTAAAAADPAKTATPVEQPLTPVAASPAAIAARAAAHTEAAVGPPAADPVVIAPRPSSPAAAPAAVAAATAAAGDDFSRIRSIDTAMTARLRSAGVTRFTEMAKWSPSDVARLNQVLGLTGRIEQENWIEQAQILASGAETEYSRRRARGEIPATATPVQAAPAAAVPPVAPIEPTPTVAVAPPAAVLPTSQGANVTALPAAASAGAAAAAAAAAAMAARNATVVEQIKPTRLADAIRENTSAAGTDPSKAAPRPDLAGLRSVRSQGLRGDVTAGETLRSGGPARPSGAHDDLKRIRGIGVLIEKKLNSLGVSAYEQVANWTNADIERVSQILDFKGRIERESWVEQARILASGGQTEFSKRVDRGEH